MLNWACPPLISCFILLLSYADNFIPVPYDQDKVLLIPLNYKRGSNYGNKNIDEILKINLAYHHLPFKLIYDLHRF